MTWTEKGWTPIKFVIRHPIRTPLKRVITHTGSVDVTDEHSLLDENAKEVRTIDLSVGDKLLHFALPLPKDTPKEPLEIYMFTKDFMKGFNICKNKIWREPQCGFYLF